MPHRTLRTATRRGALSLQRARQRGVSLLGLIFVGGVLAVVGLVAMQVFPTALEYQAIRKATDKAKVEATPAAGRAAFDRAAAIDNITSIAGKDLVFTKGKDDRQIVSFAYTREIHLAGPGYLLLKYEGRTQ